MLFLFVDVLLYLCGSSIGIGFKFLLGMQSSFFNLLSRFQRMCQNVSMPVSPGRAHELCAESALQKEGSAVAFWQVLGMELVQWHTQLHELCIFKSLVVSFCSAFCCIVNKVPVLFVWLGNLKLTHSKVE